MITERLRRLFGKGDIDATALLARSLLRQGEHVALRRLARVLIDAGTPLTMPQLPYALPITVLRIGAITVPVTWTERKRRMYACDLVGRVLEVYEADLDIRESKGEQMHLAEASHSPRSYLTRLHLLNVRLQTLGADMDWIYDVSEDVFDLMVFLGHNHIDRDGPCGAVTALACVDSYNRNNLNNCIRDCDEAYVRDSPEHKAFVRFRLDHLLAYLLDEVTLPTEGALRVKRLELIHHVKIACHR